jgi:hypothetical protein
MNIRADQTDQRIIYDGSPLRQVMASKIGYGAATALSSGCVSSDQPYDSCCTLRDCCPELCFQLNRLQIAPSRGERQSMARNVALQASALISD